MNDHTFNTQINELRIERVKLENRLQQVEDTIKALMAMQQSSYATETPIFDEVYGG